MFTPYDIERYPNRKNPRLKGYDYSSSNYYFVTVCTHDKKCIFGNPEKLNVFGNIAKKGLLEISGHYSGVSVENFVVMPNHVHLIMLMSNGNAKLDSVIGSYKSFVSRKIHEIDPNLKVWQVSFHDHIIRNQKGYENIWKYIESNPMNWEKDCFYSE